VDVQNKAVYILRTQQCTAERNDGGVRGAENVLHLPKIRIRLPEGREPTRMNIQERIDTPVERLQAELSEDMAAVNALIRERMASEHAPRIPEVTAHLVEAGGKRIRPLLTLAAARHCGYAGGDQVKLAAAVEFIHTATLLHDDVVDESAKRRGRPTANLLWDNKSSVLVGDYLFAGSFKLMVETNSLRVLEILSNASAVIAEGEVLQLVTAADLATTEQIYIQVIRGKTAALFSAATEAGAVVAGAQESDIRAFFEYGDALGISFQITDDLLDYGGVSARLGKNTGDDFRERKMSLPVIKAVACADEWERAFWERVIARNDQREGDLEEAIALMVRHGSLEETRSAAVAYSLRAKEALRALPAGPMRDILDALADFVVERIA
jgi:octaprenyl-diphosphate synthase